MRSAVLFNIFNRPELTAQSFAAIRAARPPRLYVAADGPREARPDDAKKCRLTRETALAVDWPCEVKTLLRKRNLGCKVACISAITWFFRQESEGIVLEDDCVPHADFFPYCDELLERYRHNRKIMLISGSNFQYGKRRGPASYYFSIFAHIWGWAAWADTWNMYNPHPEGMEKFAASKLPVLLRHPAAARLLTKKLLLIRLGLDDISWDYQLWYAIMNNNGLCAIPNANLVRNIGCVPDSTHVNDPRLTTMRPVEAMPRMEHPKAVLRDFEADQFACECFAAEESGLDAVLLREALKRLQEGDLEDNKRLLDTAMTFFGPREDFLSLKKANDTLLAAPRQKQRLVLRFEDSQAVTEDHTAGLAEVI
ncbi:MAG: hypothetical protein LBD82_07450 [Deltaproteobacteria bacterium]|jgi:hypothetical protein|nr:hypothetical protein [Deltaproteobacteria bacterium]